MTRSRFFLLLAVTGALAGGLGWFLGRPVPALVSPPSPPSASAPAADISAYQVAAAAPDFHARKNLSTSDILSLIEAARLDPVAQDTVDTGTSDALFSVLESLTAEEIPGVLDHLASLPPPTPDRLLAAVLGRWARDDGAAAMAWAARLTRARQDTVRGVILAGWAQNDPQAAWQWYQEAWRSAPPPRHRLEQDFPKLIHAWARHDAPSALNAILAADPHGTFDKWTGLTSLVALPERRDEIMSLISAIPDEKTRQAGLRSAMGQWSATAPAEAAAWLDTHLPDADSSTVWYVAERFGRANPRANADWLLQRTPPDQRDEAYRMCLYQWAEAAPDDAAAWLETAGPTDLSAEIFATRYARTDLDKAMSWARRVSEPKRVETIVNTLAQAQLAGTSPDFNRFAADTGLDAANLARRVEAARQILGSRL